MLEVVNQSGLVLFAELQHFLDEELFSLSFEGYCLAAEKEARAMGDKTAVPELSKQYLATVAARAAKVPVEMIMGLPAKYFTQITLKVQSFFVPED